MIAHPAESGVVVRSSSVAARFGAVLRGLILLAPLGPEIWLRMSDPTTHAPKATLSGKVMFLK